MPKPPLISLDGPTSSRSIVFPQWLWDRLGDAADVESQRTGVPTGIANIVRQGAAQRADAILGTKEEQP